MANKTVALIRADGTVDAVIVVGDDTPDGWLEEHLEAQGYDRAVDTDEISRPIGPGFVYRRGLGYLPPVEIDVELLGDDDAAVITYTDNRPGADGEVDLTVGSDSHVVVLDRHGRGTVHLESLDGLADDNGTVLVESGSGAAAAIDVPDHPARRQT